MKKIIQQLSIATCLLLSLAANLSSAGELLIGQAVPLTGVLAETGKDLASGAKIYFDFVNDNGGINGNKIKHLVKDDQYKPAETLRVVKELIEQDNVIALIGSIGAPHIAGLIKEKVLDHAGIVMMSPFAGTPALRTPFEDTKNLFHIRASVDRETMAMVEQLMTLKLDKIAVFYQDDVLVKAGVDVIAAELKKRGKEFVASASYKPAAPDDVDAAVMTIVKADPSAVIVIGSNIPAANFIKKCRPISRVALYLTLSVINPKTLHQLAGEDAARGVGITQVMPYPYASSTPVVTEYLQLLKKYGPTGATPNYTTLEQFIGAKTLVEGIRRAGATPTRDSIYKALEKMDAYDVGGFPVRFKPGNHAMSTYVEVTVISRNGKLIR